MNPETFRIRKLVATRLQQAMDFQGFDTLRKLEAVAGVTNQHISHILNCKTNASYDTLAKLGDALKVPVSYFFMEHADLAPIPEELLKSLPTEVQEFCSSPQLRPYLLLNKKAVDHNISPEELEQSIAFIMNMRNTKK